MTSQHYTPYSTPATTHFHHYPLRNGPHYSRSYSHTLPYLLSHLPLLVVLHLLILLLSHTSINNGTNTTTTTTTPTNNNSRNTPSQRKLVEPQTLHKYSTGKPSYRIQRPYECHHTASEADVSHILGHIDTHHTGYKGHMSAIIQHAKAMLATS